MAKRELTKDESEQVRRYVTEREQEAYPDHSISVAVKKDTDEDGNPVVNITRTRELEKSIKWPSR
jgi:hypothetical protein